MVKRWRRSFIILVCLLLALSLPGFCWAESSAILSQRDLQSVQAAFEVFLEELADVLIDQGMLAEEERGDWLALQLADFHVNGGYGTIAIMYTPGVVRDAVPSQMLCRMQVDIPIGRLQVDTLRTYVLQSSLMPGLPLEAGVTGQNGQPIACRFRFSATSGVFTVWDSLSNTTVYTGAVCVSDGRPVYWQEDPLGLHTETITIEVLAQETDAVLATVSFSVQAGDRQWDVLSDTFP